MTDVAQLGPGPRAPHTYARWLTKPALLQPAPRGAQAVEVLQAILGPREVEALAARVAATMQPPLATGRQAELVAALSQERTFSPQERLALEIDAALRAFENRRSLLASTLTATQVARLLGRFTADGS